MKGTTFYLDHNSPRDKRKGQHNGNVVAVFRDLRNQVGYDAIGAVYKWPDSGVASISVSAGYLRDNCKRISEAAAREIHPKMFALLDLDPPE